MTIEHPINADLLIEFLTEELPPINLEQNFGETFSKNISQELKNFIKTDSEVSYFVTPRRFATIIKNIPSKELSQKVIKKGPAISSSMENGEPNKALLGFMRSCNVTDLNALEQKEDGYFYANIDKDGQSLEEVLPNAIKNTLKKLPIAKNMRWADHEYTFVRPVHNLMIMHGDQVICQDQVVMGLKPVAYTFGHRIMSDGKIIINKPENYAEQLEQQGKVIVDFGLRRDLILQDLEKTAKPLNLELIEDDKINLLNEVTALVEYPVILQGEFDRDFLITPQECLILSMAKNQKYFALLDENGKLSNKFLFVANIKSTNPNTIIHGNQKVLSARLADAKFFFEVDKKQPLEYFLERLNNVVYHNKLGSQRERIKRLENIALSIAPSLNLIDNNTIKVATSWLKADLMTEMVGEFPELQGVMGKYYALNLGVNSEIANSIEKHYYPRFSGDELPDSQLATLMSLTDKLELLVGIWGIGLIPSGEKDPFALRRAALGIIRILLNNNLDLLEILKTTANEFNDITTFNQNIDSNTQNNQVTNEVYEFILQRLANYLNTESGFNHNVIQSIIKSNTFKIDSKSPKKLSHLNKLLPILAEFANNAKNQDFFQANKRIDNILRKNAEALVSVMSLDEINQVLIEPSEKYLFEFVNQFDISDINETNWSKYFKQLEKCSEILADFFANVMVMTDDIKLRNARLSLLFILQEKVNYLCNMSELAN
jgi:glycyl-tRNA synthetase beta chain